MPIDTLRLDAAVRDVLGNKPHPDVPEIKVNQYELYARVAARMADTNEPTPDHVRNAVHTLSGTGIAPEQFERVWDVARPLANVLLGQDPTMHDIVQLTDAHPSDIQTYYLTHPHPDAPDVQAGRMATYAAHATPIARRTIGRDPNPVELRRFALGNYTTADMVSHYTDKGGT